MKKLHIQLLTASVLALAASSAFADTSTSLKVAGKILTAPCNIQDSSNLNASFSPTGADDGASGDFLPLRFQASLNLRVKCDADTAIAVKISDNHGANKPGTVIPFNVNGQQPSLQPNNYFGLVDLANGNSVGAFTMFIGNPDVDSESNVPLLQSPDGNSNWTRLTGADTVFGGGYPDNTQPYLAAIDRNTLGSTPTPFKGKNFAFNMRVGGTLIKGTYNPNEDLKVDGGVTFEVISI